MRILERSLFFAALPSLTSLRRIHTQAAFSLLYYVIFFCNEPSVAHIDHVQLRNIPIPAVIEKLAHVNRHDIKDEG